MLVMAGTWGNVKHQGLIAWSAGARYIGITSSEITDRSRVILTLVIDE
jgi:hypothetical protein